MEIFLLFYSSDCPSSPLQLDEAEGKRYNVGVSAVIRITLRDGTYHEVSLGMCERRAECLSESVKSMVSRTLDMVIVKMSR